jgi:SPP1 gp7 family putative phage head morphogenesis protein
VTPPPEGQPAGDRRWPAWLLDTALATVGAAAILLGLRKVSRVLGRRFISWATEQQRNGITPSRSAVAAWAAYAGGRDLGLTLAHALRPTWEQGWLAGERSAGAVLQHGGPLTPEITITTDWGDFQPGDLAAARKLIREDGQREHLDGFLADSDGVIRGIVANRVDEIARVLADGLERGDPPRKIAKALEAIIEDKTWAMTTAWTEANRAVSAAALDRYAEAGIGTKGWMTAWDQRVCPICLANEEQGFIPLGARFASGDLHPPGHPRCRCAPAPGMISA